MKNITPFAAFFVLVGCATTGQDVSRPKAISYEDASAFERSLLARKSAAPVAPEMLYIQPANKKEACKLPTTQDQLDRPNFHAYWDGGCKNGLAFGLGRDIAISDTHHVEEIIVHDGSGSHWSGPRVDYDYVNNIVVYTVGGSHFPASTQASEKLENSMSGLNVYRVLSVVDEYGKAIVIQTSDFNPQKIYLNTRTDGAITYKFSDYSAVPVVNQNAVTFTAEIVDPKSNVPGGVAIARYANGALLHFKVVNGNKEPVLIPLNYAGQLYAKYQEVFSATSGAQVVLQQAMQIEREYLFKACNGKSSVAGLDNATYTKICTWRDQFKEPYAAASANYQRQLESLKQQASAAEQKNQIQQQIDLQQKMLQQQQYQQAWSEISQAGQQIQQSTQQTLQSVNSWEAPQVLPITPPGGNKVICNTIGNFTTCR